MVLCVVTNIGVFRPLMTTAVCFQITDEGSQQRGLAYTAGTDDGNPFTNFNLKIKTAEYRFPIVTLGQAFNFQRLAIEFFVLAETYIRTHTTGRLDLFQLDFVNLACSRGCLFRFGCICTEATDKRL